MVAEGIEIEWILVAGPWVVRFAEVFLQPFLQSMLDRGVILFRGRVLHLPGIRLHVGRLFCRRL